MSIFLGIDISTTATKALLIDEQGRVIAVASSPHTLQTPRPLWSEQDPHEWWNAAADEYPLGVGKSRHKRRRSCCHRLNRSDARAGIA